jgi:hypothetical protein
LPSAGAEPLTRLRLTFAEHVMHTVADVLLARMLAIACAYPDGNDFAWLRRDVAFKLACGPTQYRQGSLLTADHLVLGECAATCGRSFNSPTTRYICAELPEAAQVRGPGHR